MNSYQKYFSACLLALLTQAAFAQSAPALGTASRFAVLSATSGGRGAVICSDSTVTGNVGSSGLPAAVVQTKCTVRGASTAPVSAQVLTDFNAAYNTLKAVTCDRTLTGTLAGVTVAPGVTCFDAAATLTGKLTLGGGSSDTWLFKIGTKAPGALTGTNFSVVLPTGASACNVTWWVDAGATMTDSHFKGNILAGAAITHIGTASTPGPGTFAGRALAKAGVTLTNMTVTGCP